MTRALYFLRMEERDGEEKERIPLKELWRMLRYAFVGTGWRYAGIVFLLILSSVAIIAEPLIYGKVIDHVVEAVSQGTLPLLWSALWPLLVIWIVADIVGSASRELASAYGMRTADKVWSVFWKETLTNVLAWDPERFTNASVGGLAKKLDTAGSSMWRLSGTLLQQVLPTFISVIAFLVIGFHLDWRMTVAALSGIPLLFLMTFFAERKVEKRQNAMNQAWETFAQKLVEIFSNIVPIKTLAAENRMIAMHTGLGEASSVRQRRVNDLWALLGFSTSVARFLTRFILLFVGLWFIANGSLTLGTLVTFMGMLSTLLAPFDYMLAEVMRRISEIRSAFSRIHKDISQKNVIIDALRVKKLQKVKGEIVFDHLSYRYPNKDHNALDDIVLTIPAGSSLALVGPSGSGKSTLVRLVNRFLDPNHGGVLLDGQDIRLVRVADLRKNIGVVHQETVLFNDTVFENVRFAKPKATRAEVIEACKKAQAHEFIMQLEKTYDTLIGERGVKLSGGERQRLALARVFLADQPILILDESTSALDSETEQKLQLALQKAMKNRTTIIIAHRLSTIFMADQIAVMSKGKIVEVGTHGELLKEGGLYRRLWQMQSGRYIGKE